MSLRLRQLLRFAICTTRMYIGKLVGLIEHAKPQNLKVVKMYIDFKNI